MITIQEIREVHLELTTRCNASCPLCPRNFFGYPHNAGYPDTELRLADIEKIFNPEFIGQLDNVKINGNLGDFILAHDGIEIVEYFRRHNSKNKIDISTNGSGRNHDYWTRLAQSKPVVRFALDGLEDTHALYRQDTSFARILKNASAFIKAGGEAVWKMVLFDHNAHQIVQAKMLSRELGFSNFELVHHGRDKGPVYSRQGSLERTLGKPKFSPPEQVITFMNNISWHNSTKRYFHNRVPASALNCQTMSKIKTIYIAADGSVYPCCWTGFFPRTYSANFMQGNDQIKNLLGDFDNNALNRPLQECLLWFSKIQQAWNLETYDQGRPFICDSNCSKY